MKIDHVEKIQVKGIFAMNVFKSGELIEEYVENNLVVNGARDQIVRMIAGDFTNRNITSIAFGTSGTASTVDDTQITSQFVRAVTGFSYPAMGQVRIEWELPTTENNGMAIMEFGLLTEDGTLFARRTRANPIYKEPDISIAGYWTIVL